MTSARSPPQTIHIQVMLSFVTSPDVFLVTVKIGMVSVMINGCHNQIGFLLKVINIVQAAAVIVMVATILPEAIPHTHMGPEMVDCVMPCNWKRGCQILITIIASQIVTMLQTFTLKMAGKSERQLWTFT